LKPHLDKHAVHALGLVHVLLKVLLQELKDEIQLGVLVHHVQKPGQADI
jgi:hypothetical protein